MTKKSLQKISVVVSIFFFSFYANAQPLEEMKGQFRAAILKADYREAKEIALEIMSQYCDDNTQYSYTHNLIVVHNLLGEYSDAIQLSDKILGSEIDEGKKNTIKLRKAEILRNWGKNLEAKAAYADLPYDQYDQEIKLEAKVGQAHNERELDNFDSATNVYQDLIAEIPVELPVLKGFAYWGLGECQLAKELYNEAEVSYQEALSIFTAAKRNDGIGYVQLGFSKLKTLVSGGDLNEALSLAQKAAELLKYDASGLRKCNSQIGLIQSKLGE